MLTLVRTVVLSLSSIVAVAQDPEYFTAFYQDKVIVDPVFRRCSEEKSVGNCATIAVLKAAIVQFGSVRNVLRTLQNNDSVHNLIFRDGLQVSVSPSDIKLVKMLSGIKYNKGSTLYDSAMLLYAGISKRVFADAHHYDTCIRSFKNAVEFINSGIDTKKVPPLLGLKVKPGNRRALKSYKAAVIRCNGHASFCSLGVQENFGKPKQIRMGYMRNGFGKLSRLKDVLLLSF